MDNTDWLGVWEDGRAIEPKVCAVSGLPVAPTEGTRYRLTETHFVRVKGGYTSSVNDETIKGWKDRIPSKKVSRKNKEVENNDQ